MNQLCVPFHINETFGLFVGSLPGLIDNPVVTEDVWATHLITSSSGTTSPVTTTPNPDGSLGFYVN